MDDSLSWEDLMAGGGSDWAPEGGWPDFTEEIEEYNEAKEEERRKQEEERAREEERKTDELEQRDRANFEERMEFEKKYYGTERVIKTPEAEEEAFQIYRQLGGNQGNAVRGLMRATSEEIKSIRVGVDTIQKVFDGLPEEVQTDRRLRTSGYYADIAVEYVSEFDSRVMTPEMNAELARTLRDASETGDHRKYRAVRDAIDVCSVSKDGEMMGDFYDLTVKYVGTPGDDIPGSKYQKKTDLLAKYATSHGIDRKRAEAFEAIVFPMVDAGDSEVACLMEAGNSWATTDGEFGISDFTIHALVSEVNPRNVRDLMHAYREIPTSDFGKYEMNRKDALALQDVLWVGRDFIHDERPGIHELLEAMVQFYDSKDNEEAHAQARERLASIVSDRLEPENKYIYTGFDGKLCFEVENYDRLLTTKHRAGMGKEVDYNGMKAIDVLRRLEKNTRQESLEKPSSGDERLDELIERLEVIEKDDGTVVVDFEDVAQMVKRANELLIETQGKTGLNPSKVRALCYVERMATEAMRGIKAKDYQELGFDPSFKEIIRFNELTSSGEKYSDIEFEDFWNKVVSDFSRSWIDNPEEGYHVLVTRVMERTGRLAKQYVEEGKPRHMIDSLWSGNLTHELMGMRDKR